MDDLGINEDEMIEEIKTDSLVNSFGNSGHSEIVGSHSDYSDKNSKESLYRKS